MADREDDESLAGLRQNTFLKAPLEPCFDLFSGLLEGEERLIYRRLMRKVVWTTLFEATQT